MKTFNFYLDTKVTTWYRTSFEIEANSKKDAKKKAIQFHLDRNTKRIGWEEVEGVATPLRPEDNGHKPTEEIYNDENGNIIWDNVKK
jgi:hypothetical protein